MKRDALRIDTLRPVIHIVDSDFTARQLVHVLSARTSLQDEARIFGKQERDTKGQCF